MTLLHANVSNEPQKQYLENFASQANEGKKSNKLSRITITKRKPAGIQCDECGHPQVLLMRSNQAIYIRLITAKTLLCYVFRTRKPTKNPRIIEIKIWLFGIDLI